VRRTWLDEVLVTATRGELKAFNAPYTTQRVDVGAFRDNRMYRTTTDALRDVPAVMVQKTANAQGSPYLRGFTGYRTLMLVDGIRLNNSTFRDGPNQYWNLIDPYVIDRLEVVKGPSSVLYGSDAVGGTVQAVLRRPDGYGEGFRWYRQLYGRVATAERSYQARGEVNATYGTWLGVLAGGTYKDFGDVDGGRRVGPQDWTGYQDCSGDVRIEYRPDARTTWTFAHYQFYEDDAWRTHKTVHGLSWHGTTVGDERSRVIDEGHSLTYVRFRREKLSTCLDLVELTASLQSLRETQWRVRGNGRSDRELTDVSTYGLSGQFGTPSPAGKWTYGLEWYHDEVGSSLKKYLADGSFSSADIQGPVGDDARYDLLGLYVQDAIPLCQRLELTAGGRYTFARAHAGQVKDPQTGRRMSLTEDWDSLVGSARLSWLVDPQEHWNVYGGVSQGFRAPNLSDLTRFDTARSDELETPAPGLDPERYVNYEAGVKARYDRVAAQAAYFYTDIRDMIIRTPTGNIIDGDREVTKRNAGRGSVQGVEAAASYRFCPQWTAFAAVAWIYGEVDGYPTADPVRRREPLTRLMPTTTQVGLRWDHPNGKLWLETACTFAATADKLSASDRADTQRIVPGGTPGYTVLDVRGGWKVAEGLDLWAGVENVGNRDYRIHGSGINEPGTNFKVGARWRF
jgi:hemoglobin/transferrin/lactoferrin receptor protein